MNHEPMPAFAPESPLVTRKKALLRLLAVQEAQRLGIYVARHDVVAFSRAFRNRFALGDESLLAAWLRRAGLTEPGFQRLMEELLLQVEVENRYEAAIDLAVPAQVALWSATQWRAEQYGVEPWR